ncbi:hypothetical protein FRC09_015680 [Ceratobasidium sp. 395]|nr:hypothetical protein FRC09_015680 [Ceratobasidium sp. 395]
MFTNRDWTLQHLSDDAGEEKELPVAQQANAKDQQATRNKTPDAVNRKLLEKDALIAEKDRQLGEITNRLVTRDQELAEGVKRLAAQHQELAQIRLELVEARSCLVEAEDALGRAEEKLTSRETQLLRIQEQLNVGEPEDRLARQKEIDEIRTRMQAFEQFMLSQTANQGNKRDNNAV